MQYQSISINLVSSNLSTVLNNNFKINAFIIQRFTAKITCEYIRKDTEDILKILNACAKFIIACEQWHLASEIAYQIDQPVCKDINF